ncbi:hypothetical protein BDV25DRAFT_157439, partial [Aspergillus avenaceus]
MVLCCDMWLLGLPPFVKPIIPRKLRIVNVKLDLCLVYGCYLWVAMLHLCCPQRSVLNDDIAVLLSYYDRGNIWCSFLENYLRKTFD